MKKILTPFVIKDMELKNRIVMPPMCMYSAKEDGLANPWHYSHYTTRAVGNVGLIIVEATAVSPEGRITDNDLGIWNDDQRDRLAAIVQAVQQLGSKIGIQLQHAGRKSQSAVLPHYSVSDQAFNREYIAPQKLKQEDYPMIADAFQQAAKRALEAGFDLIEIHGAHGYLLSEAISPLTRPELVLSERLKLLDQVIQAVKQVWPEQKPLQVRISASDWRDDGLSQTDLIQLAKHLQDLGVDSINVSSGGVSETAPRAFPGYQVPFSEIIKQHIDMATIAGGLINSIDMATEIIENRRADMVFLGRELLRNPYFVHQLARRFDVDDMVPTQYRRA